MGVIKKVLYRGEILGAPRHRNLFLDMEENIHIHYRDLRIELSRNEFEDVVNIFQKQSRELLEIIEKKNYQDGKLPNANQDDVRIWTESALKSPVKYHPSRVSLEECGDGYHFHYRNYKLLIDPAEFRQIAELFGSLSIDAPFASTYDEVVNLLDANEIDYVLDGRNFDGSTLAIAAAKYHLPKIRDIFAYIGFSKEVSDGQTRYIGTKLKVIIAQDKVRPAQEYRRIRGGSETVRFVNFLANHGATGDVDQLNLLKCQVIDLYHHLLAGDMVTVDIDPERWLYLPTTEELIFPYSAKPRSGKRDAEMLYNAWRGFVNKFGVGFVKPSKEVFSNAELAALGEKINATWQSEVASFRCVSKIFMMGSAVRGDLGRYRAPFVHGALAKLGSDVDLLVEIDPAYESDIPAHWKLINQQASNFCAVYHVAEIPMANGAPNWKQRFPNIRFIEHLIDAYVHFPSRGHQAEKDAFLTKFKAVQVYSRGSDRVFFRNEEEQRIAEHLSSTYGLDHPVVEKMKVSTQNAIYKIFVDERRLILKLFKVSGNYHRSRVIEHTDYEEVVVAELVERGVKTAAVVPACGKGDKLVEGFPALLFERISGTVQQKPEYELEKICRALAIMHRVQQDRAFRATQTFTFDEVCMIWLPAFDTYWKQSGHGAEIAGAFLVMNPVAEKYHPGANRLRLYERSAFVHCHGDVTPKNVIVSEVDGVCFFDFNNAFYGPRMADVIDGAFEFSLAEKYIHLADFSRFDAFVDAYSRSNPLTAKEVEDVPRWIELISIIKFAKEIRVMLENPKEELRRGRALAIASFVKSRFADR